MVSEAPDIREEVRSYIEAELHGLTVSHLERVAVEHVAGQRYEIWYVHVGQRDRWWVVTNPMFLYSQKDLRSQDVALTFHIGLALRVMARTQPPIDPTAREIFKSVWRRWEQAAEALASAEEAEEFQAVGTHLRESLVSLSHEIAEDLYDGLNRQGDTHRPKQSDFVAWAGLLIHAVTPSDSNRRLRQYLIGLVEPTWGYVQHLIHSKNSVRIDGEIALEAVSHLISMLTAAVIRSLSQARRCKHCESYAMAGAQCRKCGWEDPDYVPPVLVPRSAEEIAADLATPHTLTSDVRIRKTVNELTEPRRRSGPPNAGRRQPRR
jgi:hypothetical protein